MNTAVLEREARPIDDDASFLVQPSEKPALRAPISIPMASVRLWDLCFSTVAATLIPLSLLWDFSWESSIGVDRFWSPPHLAMHIGIWLSGLGALRLVFRRPAIGITIGRFRAPSGAWIILWSVVTLQTALLFDAWWQRVYGLSAGLWHPPQILKAVGFFGLLIGTRLLCAPSASGGRVRDPLRAALVSEGKPRGGPRPANQRTLSPRNSEVVQAFFVPWVGGLVLVMCVLVLSMTNYPNLQHTGSFYLISAAVYPAVLLAFSGSADTRWASTRVALAYSALLCAVVWLLPIFPAHPLTPPIYNPVDHMMPPPFPLLLVAPAIAFDLLKHSARTASRPGSQQQRTAHAPSSFSLSSLRQCACSATAFVVSFLPTQWFFAQFLLSPASNNWFFAGDGQHWPFFLKIDKARFMFWNVQQDPVTWLTVVFCLLLATVSAWLGLRVANWLQKVRR
jgi:hypothetical protein